MGAGRGSEIVKRGFRTMVFIVILFMSFLASSLPLLMSVMDVVAPYILLSTLICRGSRSAIDPSWSAYNFRKSLIDIPILSLIRSLAMLCTYTLCGIMGMNYEPYFVASIMSALGSMIFLSMKGSLFANVGVFHMNHEVLLSLHTKRVWGIFLLFSCSMAMSLGHIIVAYKVKCQAQRKMQLYRLDLESVNTFLSTRLNERYKRHVIDEDSPLHDLSLKFLTNQGKS